jgi:hypothetical protein
MIQLYVPVVLLTPGLNGMFCLSNRQVDLHRDALNAWCFDAEVILDGLKETCSLCFNSTLLMWLEVGPKKGKKATNDMSFLVETSLRAFWHKN